MRLGTGEAFVSLGDYATGAPADNAQFASRQDSRESNARTYARRMRIAIRQAKGVRLTDADGKTYFDCLAAAGTMALGHNHPAVVAALREALDSEVPFQTLDIATPLKDEFTHELLGTLPTGFASRARIQFCGPSGSDAIEAAIKLVRTATSKSAMLAFDGGYHGMTQGALSLMGNIHAKKVLGPLGQPTQFLPYPHPFRCPFGLGGEATGKVSAQYIRSLLQDPEGGMLPAGMVMELVQGEGGVVPAPDTWAREMRALTRELAIPLVVDEVQTGWGRTGSLYAFEHSGITPDVLVLSKAIGGGLPLSVIVYDEDLDLWEAGAHAGTFRGNTLAMAAGLATLRVIREQDLPRHAAQMGARLTRHLREIQGECALIGDVRGRGLMVGVEIVDPDGQPDAQGHLPADGVKARVIQQECFDRGLIVEMGGRNGSVARFLPPLVITAEDIDAVSEIFRAACMAAMRTA